MNRCSSFRTAIHATGLALTNLFALFTLPFVSPALAGEVSLSPTRLHVSIPPGRDYTHAIEIRYGKETPGDRAPLRFALSFEEWTMTEEGDLSFSSDSLLASGSAIPWITVSPREQEILPGEIGEARITIAVPQETAAGEYRAAVILDPRSPYRPLDAGEKRFDCKLRLSTVLYIEVPPVRSAVDLLALEVAPGRDGWKIRSTFQNLGQTHLRIEDWYDLVNLDDPTGERPLLAIEREEAGVVLPERLRVIERTVPPFTLYPGRFRLIYRADPGRGLPAIEASLDFEVPEPFPIDPLAARP